MWNIVTLGWDQSCAHFRIRTIWSQPSVTISTHSTRPAPIFIYGNFYNIARPKSAPNCTFSPRCLRLFRNCFLEKVGRVYSTGETVFRYKNGGLGEEKQRFQRGGSRGRARVYGNSILAMCRPLLVDLSTLFNAQYNSATE